VTERRIEHRNVEPELRRERLVEPQQLRRRHGRRRHLTSKSGVICSAFLADHGNSLPTLIAPLTNAKKTKQKGD
jgi:hypothetical protein